MMAPGISSRLPNWLEGTPLPPFPLLNPLESFGWRGTGCKVFGIKYLYLKY
jgi:hypothetical protein